jgi:hypothetical protein
VLTGWLAGPFPLPVVVGCWGIVGVLFMVLISTTWPAPATIADAVAANRAASEADLDSGVAEAAEPEPVAAEVISEPPAADPTVVEPVAARAAEAAAGLNEDTVDLGRPGLRRRPSPGPKHRGAAKVSPAGATPRHSA